MMLRHHHSRRLVKTLLINIKSRSHDMCKYQQQQSVHFSSINPSLKQDNNHNNPNNNNKPDPFGLNEETSIAELIQGLYIVPPKQKDPPISSSSSSDTSSTSQHYNNYTNNNESNNQQIEGQSTSQNYKDEQNEPPRYIRKFGLLKSRAQIKIDKDLTAEKVFAAHYGEIRLDSDNIVQIDGQYDEKYFDPENDYDENSISSRKYDILAKRTLRNVKERGLKTEAEIEAQNTKMMMKSLNNNNNNTNQESSKTKEEQEEEKQQKEANDVIKIVPNTVHDYLRLTKLAEKLGDATLKAKIGSSKEITIPKSIINVDPIKHVPKVYTKLILNDVTHEDVWYFLKKEICFENDFLIALNKPAGIPMHSPSVECRHTIIDFLPEFAKHANVSEIFPCHRLDKDTTGVLLLAKSEQAANAIKQKFAHRTIHKLYFAICKNIPEVREGTIKIPIGEGKIPKTQSFRAVLKPDLQKFDITTMQKNCQEAITKFQVVGTQSNCSFIEVRPETGLTHQIRVHLAHALGCPIIGDHKYSHREKMAPQRLSPAILDKLKVKQSKVRLLPLHLHCSKLEFTMPDGFSSNPKWKEPIFIHAKPPNYFMHTLRVLRLKS